MTPLRPRLAALLLFALVSGCNTGHSATGSTAPPSTSPAAPTVSESSSPSVAVAETKPVVELATASAGVLRAAGVVSIVSLKGTDPQPVPQLAQAWVDFSKSPAAISYQVAESAGKVTTIISLPGAPLYVKLPDRAKWSAIGPKAVKGAGIAGLTTLMELFTNPLGAIGVSPELRSEKGFEKVGLETLPAGVATHWRAVPLPASAGVTQSVDVWLDDQGFPVRLIQRRKDGTYTGIDLAATTAGTHFVPPPTSQIVAVP
jgi:hypothetical protein